MTASVRLHGIPIGKLYKANNGGISFRYEGDWLKNPVAHPLSLSLPLRSETFLNEKASPFFDGLLPDSKTVRKTLYSHFDVSTEYDLLYALGRDCPGAITIVPEDFPVTSDNKIIPEVTPLSELELATHIRALPRRPLFVDADGEVRLSLAGMHGKAAVIASKNNIALPRNGTPSTHILKVDIDSLPDSARVENFCLHLAKGIGIPVSKSAIHSVESIPFMITARYDRRILAEDGNRYVARIHQEDFCQALGHHPHQKYEKHGGPGWKECFNLLYNSANAVADRAGLLDRCIFQYLSNNPDAHSKNYSILYGPNGFRLSPLYDVNNAEAYRDQFKKQLKSLAMSIGGEHDPLEITTDHWAAFADDVGLSPDFVLNRIDEMATRIVQAVTPLRDSFKGTIADTELLDIAHEDILNRAQAILNSRERRLRP